MWLEKGASAPFLFCDRDVLVQIYLVLQLQRRM